MFESELVSIDHVLPESIYIIPIRYRPIFPGIVTPLIISQGRFADVIDKIIHESRTIGLVLIKDDDKDEIETEDLYSFGTAAKILKRINLPDGGINVLINSVKRFKIKKIVSDDPYILADVDYKKDKNVNKMAMKEIERNFRFKYKKYIGIRIKKSVQADNFEINANAIDRDDRTV